MKNVRKNLLRAALLLLVLCLGAAGAEGVQQTGTVSGTAPAEQLVSLPITAAAVRAADSVAPVHRVTISWNTEAGSYEQQNTVYTWDPDTMQYTAGEGGGWTENVTPAIVGSVTNFSNTPVKAYISFAPAEGITAVMTDGNGAPADGSIIVRIGSAVAGTPAEMADAAEDSPLARGTARTEDYAARFHVTDGFELLGGEGGRIGTVTVSLLFGVVDVTYTDNGGIRGGDVE